MKEPIVRLEIRGPVGLITLNRPEALNALSTELMDALTDALRKCENDPAIGCMVLTGQGRAFAAGADIKEMANKTYAEAYSENFITRNWEEATRCRKPVIAAVNGLALGGGCELAMMCDFILCADTARFGQPEVKVGVMPGAGGTQRLSRSIGKSKAMEMCLTGRMMSADEAERCGLVSRVLPADELIDEAVRVATQIAELSRPMIMMTKEAVDRSFEVPLSEGVRFERRLAHTTFALEDHKEGAAAFAEKRKPNFHHR
ncbi:MAG: enoyl-CoA hydratase [Rhodopseudomonas palustris]|uniref:enoyl-CoA hydratase n=1 Tax=Rhodopseudomonas palustris TaxID=1076 RepID=A0A933VZX8_RHOPL|nr:enoyl-CoA hydratase [Rhodopseudomonas palustris]